MCGMEGILEEDWTENKSLEWGHDEGEVLVGDPSGVCPEGS